VAEEVLVMLMEGAVVLAVEEPGDLYMIAIILFQVVSPLLLGVVVP